jgi:hypothetical protein
MLHLYGKDMQTMHEEAAWKAGVLLLGAVQQATSQIPLEKTIQK